MSMCVHAVALSATDGLRYSEYPHNPIHDVAVHKACAVADS